MLSDLQTIETVETVEKESIPTLTFAHDEVLTTAEDRARRRHDAERATTLGNAYHNKLGIYFRTADGATKRVNTTIWAADAEHITLKSGALIPLRAVLRFEF
ncbi:hypothetical protein LJY25_01255 [Hymenobacter sp. BT175]|uniref:hypothetical protein n=1 Tax=Hymenobacter translucens TaxID=2886507 RepID=UPI001D0EBE67|nr:hypothetical protein [Hymenobacter translucens]MCC2545057.1 hypothetical protein [Hymenobacter translucens]